MAEFKVGQRVRLPEYMSNYSTVGGNMLGTIRGVYNEVKPSYAVEFDEGQMMIGHPCNDDHGIPIVPSGRGWWFGISPRLEKDALRPIETSPFLMAVADYVSREMGRT